MGVHFSLPPKLLCFWLFTHRSLQRGGVYWFHTSRQQRSILMALGKAQPWQKGNLQNPLPVLVMNWVWLFCVYALKDGGDSMICRETHLHWAAPFKVPLTFGV